ncbi:MAG TPA: DUF222 domain-containing protein [Streptosporangiaceae bacterium]|nr:DUF222 domain-containing protein [Streptosporangiaceae bacterium]
MYVSGQSAEPANGDSAQAPGPAPGGGAGSGRAGAAGAISAVLGGLGSLARLSAADLPAAGQADCLRALERAESMLVAARSAVLAAFTASAAYTDDGQYSPKTWLAVQTRVTRGAAAGSVTWMRRLADHPAVAAELAAGDISGSWARQICEWTDRLPAASREAADGILLAAQAGGATLADLAALAEEMFRRCAPPDGDGPGDPASRGVILDTHFRGAGKLDGDLTPRCAAALSAILEALGKKQGAEDHRTLPQRYHDALEEACRRLIAAGGLPDRAGQPTQIQLHMTLDQLMRLNGGSGLDGSASDGSASDGSASDGSASDGSGPDGSGPDAVPGWLPGPAAGPGAACDATIVPVVSGRVDPVLLDQLAAQLLSRGAAGIQRHAGTSSYQSRADVLDPAGQPTRPAPVAPDARQTASDLVLADAVRLLSGPGGLAAALRAGVPCPPAAAASLPLDIGRATDTIPPHLRRAVIVRDRKCRFPGCQQPAAACDIHHVIWRTRGGRTQLINLILLCRFHHLIAIHQWGWTITLHPDATVTAVSPDGRRTLHSHSPPGTLAA